MIVNPRYATQECERAPETAKAAFCDEVSGLRYYNPTEGRWLSRDPIEEQGGVNIYAFVRNRPITDIDSLGEDFIAVGTRVLNGWLGTFGGTAMPSNHMSIEYYYGCAKEGQEFTAGDPPNGTTRAGARELLEESSYSRVIKGKHQTVAISFIYTTSHARDLVVIYAEADADKKWKEVENAAGTYLFAEHGPKGYTLRNWPNSKYGIPWTSNANNSNTFIRVLAWTIHRNADVVSGFHPGNDFPEFVEDSGPVPQPE